MSLNAIGTYTNTYVPAARTKSSESPKTNRSEKQSAVSEQKSTDEYLEELQKNNPELNLTVGSANPGVRQGGVSGRTNVAIAPNILKQMANDPEAEKKYGQMLKDIPAAARWADSMIHALTGSEVKYRQTWIDENGNMGSMCVTGPSEEQKKLNEEISQKKKEEKEEWMEKIKENRKQKREELEELLKDSKSVSRNSEYSDMFTSMGFDTKI